MPPVVSYHDVTRTSDRDATRSESSVNLCGGGIGRQRWREEAAFPGPSSEKEKLDAMVVLRFFAERWVAKWTVAAARRCPAQRVSRETERGSTMYRRT